MRLILSGTLDGEQIFRRAINKLVSDASDLRNLNPKRLANIFYVIETEQFDSEGRRGRSKWAALKKSYAKRKEQEGFGSMPILQKSTKLLFSLATGDSEYSVYDPQPRSLTLGTTHPAARSHHFGAPARNLPERKLIVIKGEDQKAFRDAILDENKRIARQAGFVVTN